MNSTEEPKQSSTTAAWAIGLFFLWMLLAANSNSKGSSSRATDYPANHASSYSPTSTVSQQRSLERWYANLSVARAALKSEDQPAIIAFNEEAARYMAAVHEFRRQQPAPAPSDAYARANVYTTPPSSYFGATSSTSAVTESHPATGSSRSTASSSYYDSSYRSRVQEHYVNSHVRSDGTVVGGHYRTNRDGSFWNNYSAAGNVNPHTGRVGTALPSGSAGGSTYVRGYTRSNGTYVAPHYRSR